MCLGQTFELTATGITCFLLYTEDQDFNDMFQLWHTAQQRSYY